ncbi:PQQ-binding-like beta-propeller repeat protein [Nocardiopsis sp. HNM0947]|uniref:PQQ-binding-like beta-propeller repeat protein n=1 Tax=Nocardiopsis coralli TaxID=2772213 RepID=A0ABR9PBK7_9ACTN|nr:PQQ-binding-like beta-propeller repeat protein [Nocardiopsis coralli]MBE3001225.1 PQQ-binding-like beta-propeller repeat protein [Nocardiopsis coralli]
MRAAIAWVGLGLIAGALVWAVVAAVLYSHHALYVEDEQADAAARAVMVLLFSCTIGCVILGFGVRWTERDAEPEPESEPEPMVRQLVYLVGLLLVAAFIAFPNLLTDGFAQLITARLQVWLATGAVWLGFLLFMLSGRRPSPRPLVVTFSAFLPGALVVFLAGALVHIVPYPEVHHSTADAPGDPAPVPDAVSEVGWTWEPEPEVSLERVEEGVHGPLVVLSDGVVSLDGTDGSEVWSFRRHADEDVEVVVGEQHVFVSYRPFDAGETEGEEEVAFTETFDLATGEPVPGHEREADAVHGDPDVNTDHVVRFPGQVVRDHWPDSGSPAELQALEVGSGRELWTAPLHEHEGQDCLHRGPTELYGAVVMTEQCMDEEDRDHPDLGAAFSQEGLKTESIVTAFDPESGKELWQRRWTGAESRMGSHARPGGHTAEGASPVILVDPTFRRFAAVLDPATGEDAVTLPADVDDPDNWFRGFAGADSDGATYLVERADRRTEFERVNVQGEVVATIDPGRGLDRRDESSVALNEMVLFSSAVESRPTVVARSFDNPEVDGLIPLESPNDRDSDVDLLPVPGAVAASVERDGSVSGLVP